MPDKSESTADAETGRGRSPVREAAAALVSAHRLLGREFGALADEEQRTATSSKDRAATLRRKKHLLRDVSRHLAGAVSGAAVLVGLQELGADGQYPEDADGKPRTELTNLEAQDSDAYSWPMESLAKAIDALRQVYVPTVKNPDLAHPEDRQAMAEVVAHLRTAHDVLTAVMDEDEDETACLNGMLAELESTCAPLPVPQVDLVDLSDEDVIARVLADPRLAARTGRALRQQRQTPVGGAAS
ncbi:hypothetical protein [Kitasatospora phosalacinea]|uniref:Uncharacterized protein n=1 Tax=Kitasatospora phosalacinea TaxID=2065 RepID=A0A9W6PN80_9ACTN|nr:hypothetical protein [Kitasatospora phosalacinea]GLW58131.1 hypothetical protein Kpho01_61420 [Kitasatospora phosalacinea]